MISITKFISFAITLILSGMAIYKAYAASDWFGVIYAIIIIIVIIFFLATDGEDDC